MPVWLGLKDGCSWSRGSNREIGDVGAIDADAITDSHKRAVAGRQAGRQAKKQRLGLRTSRR